MLTNDRNYFDEKMSTGGVESPISHLRGERNSPSATLAFQNHSCLAFDEQPSNGMNFAEFS
jgi:hypothetical protein